MSAPRDLTVDVAVEPIPGLLRPAIEAVLAGHAWPDGPEATIAQAVAHAARPAESRPDGRSS